ncbi:MAG: CoA pyrophosphatase [Anaerolineae bacterium]|nr:CoA pyrophosphatase [Anaerolineae bacterium]
MIDVTLYDVKAALALANFDVDAARQHMRPRASNVRLCGEPRRAGVLTLLYPHNGALNLALIKRTVVESDPHSGQIAFPGGRQEEGEALAQTALREAHEEVGVPPGAVELIGRLAALDTRGVTFTIHPFVGYTPACPVWAPQPAEVARVLEMPVPELLNDAIKDEEWWNLNGSKVAVPFYRWDGETIWGATGMVLSELEWRLRAVLKEG